MITVTTNTCQISRFNCHLQTLLKCCYTNNACFSLSGTYITCAMGLIMCRLCICCNNTFVVTKNNFTRCLRNNVVRHNRCFSTTARCINNEKHGRKIFYGAMIAEGVIGLIWVTLGMSFYSDTAALAAALGPKGNAALVVNNISVELLGVFGGALAVLGVVVLPVTSGDTAFRSARLVLADWFKLDQKKWKNRLLLCVPVLGVGAILGVGNALGAIDYTIIWRYFSWTNQTLAMIVLWAASMYLFYDKKNYWLTAVPATFMSAVSATYFLLGNECLGQLINHKAADGTIIYNTAVAYPVGIAVAALFLGIFLYTIKKRHTQPHYETLGK